MEKSKIELIKEFIETCPYLKKGKVNVDYIKDKPQSYSIDETPVDPILINFPDGGKRLQIQFDFSIQSNFSVLEKISSYFGVHARFFLYTTRLKFLYHFFYIHDIF